MKALVKYALCMIVICLMALGCVENKSCQKEETIIKRMSVIDGNLQIGERMWGISDGIKVIRGNRTEYFYFDIESPPGVVRDKADIQFTYRLDSLDNIVYEKEVTCSVDSLCPFYKLNSLNVFNVNNQYGAYFYTSLLGYPYGIDPYELVMWVYYDEELYKFSGVVSQHQDWSWEETYSFSPDEKLKLVSEEAYKEVVNLWGQHIQNYKEFYNRN